MKMQRPLHSCTRVLCVTLCMVFLVGVVSTIQQVGCPQFNLGSRTWTERNRRLQSDAPLGCKIRRKLEPARRGFHALFGEVRVTLVYINESAANRVKSIMRKNHLLFFQAIRKYWRCCWPSHQPISRNICGTQQLAPSARASVEQYSLFQQRKLISVAFRCTTRQSCLLILLWCLALPFLLIYLFAERWKNG